MTPPALVWKRYDVNVAPMGCSHVHCDRTPSVMRGPRSPLIRLPWRPYCALHAVLYGLPRQRFR